jgi:hypothetical protein
MAGVWLAWIVAGCVGVGVAGMIYFSILRPMLADLGPYVADWIDDLMSRRDDRGDNSETLFSASEQPEQRIPVQPEQPEQAAASTLERDIMAALPVIFSPHEYLDLIALVRLDTLARGLASGAIRSEAAAIEAAFSDTKRGGSKRYTIRLQALRILAEHYGYQAEPPPAPAQATPIAGRAVPPGVTFDDAALPTPPAAKAVKSS